jgi:hypothetical protein
MNYLNIVLVLLAVVTLIYFYFSWKNNIENFESLYAQNDQITKLVDSVSVLPDPLGNPNKLVVVITKDEYIWKYDIVPVTFDKMNDEIKQNIGLDLIRGYPKLISEEWIMLDSYFHDGIKSISLNMNNMGHPEVYFFKNRYKQTYNIINKWKGIKMATAYPTLLNDTQYIDLNQGFDNIISGPDFVIPVQEANYISNIFPRLEVTSTGTFINNSVYKYPLQIYKGDKSYVLDILNNQNQKVSNWSNTLNIKIKPYNEYYGDGSTLAKKNMLDGLSPTKMINYQGFVNYKLGTDINNTVFLNDLMNCVFYMNNNDKPTVVGIERCNIWHQIRRSPRCAYTYPFIESRQYPTYTYVFNDNKVWKYKSVEVNESINTILSLVQGYPKLVSDEYPNLRSEFTYHVDAVWVDNNSLYFMKGRNVCKYDFKTKSSSSVFTIETVFPEVRTKYIEAIVQTYESDSEYVYIYSNNKYLKYVGDTYRFKLVSNWSDVPSNENYGNDFLMCGWYHPIMKTKVLTYMRDTYMGNKKYKNVNLYDSYSKTVILNDTPNKAYLMIQQTILGESTAVGMKLENGKMMKIDESDFLFEKFWNPIKNKNIPEMCGIIYAGKINNMRYVFAHDKYYNFVESGVFNESNYIMNLFGNNNSSNNKEFPINFDSENKIIPINFDFCFDDGDDNAWFFKNQTVWKFNLKSRQVEDIKPANSIFKELEPTTDSAIFDWDNKKVYFIRGNVYSLYDYNPVSSKKVQDEVPMIDMFSMELVNDIASNMIKMTPTSNTFSKVYNVANKSLNINSLHNFIENGDLMDTTKMDTLGNITVNRQIVTNKATYDLPFSGNVMVYTMNGGDIIDLTLQELYVSDIVFSFYVKKDNSSPEFNINVMTQSKESTQVEIPVTNQWRRIEVYQWQDYDYPFKLKVSVPATGNKVFYASGFQLENNFKPLPVFSGRVFHTWDETNPPEIGYLYNLNYLSTIPPQQQQLDIADLMSYNTLNQERTNDDMGFKKEQAVYFDGNKVFMVIPTTAISPTKLENFSISGWIRFRKFSQPDKSYQSLWGVYNNENNNINYMLVEEIGGKIRVRIKRQSISFGHKFESVNLMANKWYFIALTIFEGKIRLYAYNYYEETSIDDRLAKMDINQKIMVGVPADYNDLDIYKDKMLNADIGSISVWRRSLRPEDIKILSRTFKDVKLAMPEIKRKQLVGTGLPLIPMDMKVDYVDGLGLCTYNVHIIWQLPEMPQDYKKLGYNVVKYDTKLEYYIDGNLISGNNLEPYIMSEKITKDVQQIKIITPSIECNNCKLSLLNVPYEYNYRLYVRYILSNKEASVWSEMDLKFKEELVPKFGINGNTTCQYKVYEIHSKDKIRAEQIQNKFLEYSRKKLQSLKPN